MKKNSFRILIALLTFLIGVSSVCFWYFNPTNKAAADKTKTWERLLSFENQDLSKLNNDQKIKLFNDFYRLINKQIYVGFGEEVLFTKLSNEQNQINYILIGTTSPPVSHSATALYFQIFDQNANHLNSIKIDINEYFRLEDVKVYFSSEIGREIIEVTGNSFYENSVDKKQIYILQGNEILLNSSKSTIK